MATSHGVTSYEILVEFAKFDPADPRKCDASGILSRECYEAWFRNRRKGSVNPEDSFRRTITSHVSGTKKRKPFPEPVETDLLKHLRLRKVWKCFLGYFDADGQPIFIGRSGFRAKGYHEQRNEKAKNTSDSSAKQVEASFTKGQEVENLLDGQGQESLLLDTRNIRPLETSFNDGREQEIRFHNTQDIRLVETSFDGREQEIILDEIEYLTDGQASTGLELGYPDFYPEIETYMSNESDSVNISAKKRTLDEAMFNWFVDTMISESAADAHGTGRDDESRRNFHLKRARMIEQYNEEVFNGELRQQRANDPEAALEMAMFQAEWIENYELMGFMIRMVTCQKTCSNSEAARAKMNELNDNPQNFVDEMLWALFSATTPKIINDVVTTRMQDGVDMSTIKPEELFHTKMSIDPRFKATFRYANEKTCPMDPTKPIGRNILDMETSKFVHCDDAAISIMRGTAVGRTTAELNSSTLLWWLGYMQVVPILCLRGEIYFHGIAKRLDGTPVVYVHKYVKKGRYIHTAFQVVNDQFPELLKREDLFSESFVQ